jgi:hypothetical protein
MPVIPDEPLYDPGRMVFEDLDITNNTLASAAINRADVAAAQS